MSINSVNLTGRLTRDPDVRYTDGGTSKTHDRPGGSRGGAWSEGEV